MPNLEVADMLIDEVSVKPLLPSGSSVGKISGMVTVSISKPLPTGENVRGRGFAEAQTAIVGYS